MIARNSRTMEADVGDVLVTRIHGLSDTKLRMAVDVPHGTRLTFCGLSAEDKRLLRIRNGTTSGRVIEDRRGLAVLFDGHKTPALWSRLRKGVSVVVGAKPHPADDNNFWCRSLQPLAA